MNYTKVTEVITSNLSPSNVYGHSDLRTASSLYSFPESRAITLVDSREIEFTTKAGWTGRRWVRDRVHVYRRHPRTNRFYHYTKNCARTGRRVYPWPTRVTSFAMGTSWEFDRIPKFRETLCQTLGYANLSDIFPILGQLPVANYELSTIPKQFYGLLQAPDMKAFCEGLFGVSRYRRDLGREAARNSLITLAYAEHFRGLVPIDWIIKLLADTADSSYHPRTGVTYWHRNPWRLLKQLHPKTLRRLAKTSPLTSNELYAFIDARHDIWGMPPDVIGTIEARSWTEFHARANAMARRQQRLAQAEYNMIGEYAKPIVYNDLFNRLHGTQVGDLTIHLAQSTEEPHNWGDETNCCIGSYACQAYHGSVILGVLQDRNKTIKALFSINRSITAPSEQKVTGHLGQFLGPRNSLLPDEFRAPVIDIFLAHGIKCNHYWGS